MKVASDLVEFLAYEKDRSFPMTSTRVHRQARALLAVARAARRMMSYNGCGRQVCGTGLDRDCPAVKATDRALARLERASKGGGRP